MTADTVEDLDRFRQRAGAWIRSNLRPLDHAALAAAAAGELDEEEELAAIQHERHLMRMMFDAGFAGITISPEYGGQGLSPAHQRVFNEELSGFEHPSRLMVPNLSPCAAVLLDFGTEEQKKTHIPAILKGEELWMQLLSEPSGGSDVAGALTTAVRDGDEWVLNGSKIWTTGAWWSDWGLCLARTNWDVPKHRGLTVFMLPLHREGVDVHRIEMLNGSKEFCQEFLTDVRVPDTDRIGEVDKGWTVGTRWMFHERMLYNSPLITMPAFGRPATSSVSPVEVARDRGRLDDPLVRDLIGEAAMLDLVGSRLQQRIAQGVRTGRLSDQGAAIARLFGGVAGARSRTITFQIAGEAGAAWSPHDGAAAGRGTDFLMRQAGCIGGGTTEMARNVVSERVLGMPRERSVDRDVPFREVPRGPSADARSRS
ncbi:MAG: acyl-CoA dehydrogenase family protein [Acidobacteriota bacterium]|nr:acyl-CoA dehydrogenase family protein [Acidobacteriota bacterium]